MKKFAAIFVLLTSWASAQMVTIDFGAGGLRDQANAPLADGRLVLLIAAVASPSTAGTGFSTLSAGDLTTGSYLNAGQYQILARAEIDSSSEGPGTVIGTTKLNEISTPNLSFGDQLAIVWFPNLTYATSFSLLSGSAYGLYTVPNSSEWTTPANGSIVTLTAPYDLKAAFFTASAIPEPSTYAALAGAAALALAAYRKRTLRRS